MKKVLIATFIILLMVGCQYISPETLDNALEKEVYQHTESDLVKILISKIGEHKQLEVSEVQHVDNASFGKFLLKDSKQISEGIFYATDHDGWEIQEVEMYPYDSEIPFTRHGLVASLQDGSNRTFYLVSGYINDKRIREIHIDYIDGSTSVFKLNDEKDSYLDYFIYSDEGELNPTKEIVGLDENGNKVYQYEL